MAAEDEPDETGEPTDPLGPARPLLQTALRLADRATAAGDPDGAHDLLACAARLARRVRGLGEIADFRLERALDEDDDPDPAALRDAIESLLGDDDPPIEVPPSDPQAATVGFIEAAISIGAPAYNTGDKRGCYDVYSCTARMILATLPGPESARTRLRAALDRAAALDDPDAQAWAMRHGFDAILEGAAGGPALSAREVSLLLSVAIRIGAPAFNLGDHRGCYEVYACTARLVANSAGPADAVKDKLKEALREASTLPDVARQAWLLRHAFDSLLAADGDAPPASS